VHTAQETGADVSDHVTTTPHRGRREQSAECD
jgi:hypothetical protein